MTEAFRASAYVDIWEYLVKSECTDQFREHYGPQGMWVELFSRASGFVRTESYTDRKRPERFITVDYWEARADRDRFRQQFATAYAALGRSV